MKYSQTVRWLGQQWTIMVTEEEPRWQHYAALMGIILAVLLLLVWLLV